MKSHTKVILAGMVGNALEAYDYMLYGVFAAVIAQEFFPSEDPTVALLSSLGAFAAGFLMRPFGGIVYGHIGDTYGRKFALTASIFLMATPTFLIGLLPNYTQIGIAAPIILIICRLMQGFAAAGEYSGAAIFVIEHNQQRGTSYAGSMILVSSFIGSLIATALGAITLSPSMPPWAWRVLFLMGIVVGAIGLYVRLKIDESPEFKKIASQRLIIKSPLKKAILHNPSAIFVGMVCGGVAGALGYTLMAYMNIYLHKVVGLAVNHSMLFNSAGLLVFLIVGPLIGRLADQIGIANMMRYGAWAVILGAYPAYSLLQTATSSNIIMAQILFALICACIASPVNAFINSLFPTQIRYSGVGFSYNVGIALLGGTMPLVSTYFITLSGSKLAPAFYLMGCGVLALIAIQVGKKLITSEKNKVGNLDVLSQAA